jgi:hypothetical protein
VLLLLSQSSWPVRPGMFLSSLLLVMNAVLLFFELLC